MSDQKKGILPTGAIAPALLAMHKATTGAEPKPGDFFSFKLDLEYPNGCNDAAIDRIRVTPEMIQIANVIFMQYSQMAKMMVTK
jgi:hypothetical protein